MAAHRTLRPLRRLLQLKGVGNSRSATQGPRSSCVDTAAPPCAPCDRAAPPPCRALPHRTRPALRVTCCAPQPRAPPPCDPQHHRLTCIHARPVNEKTRKTKCNRSDEACGAELDRVARRLAAAENTRRDDYEREARGPPAPTTATPAPPYRLAPERECVRATDGCDYTLAAPATRPGEECPRCGPDRRPPEPRLVELAPSDACEPDRGLELDPCAHRPRVLLHVDRAPSQESPPRPVLTSPAPSGNCVAQRRPSSRERLTTRIMETLNLKRENKSTCPKQTCSTRDSATDIADRCAKLPKPAAAPQRCREPSVVEQLRRRPGGTPGRRCGETRRLHTSASSSVRTEPCSTPTTIASGTKDIKNNIKNGIEVMLRDRSQFKDAARGRVVQPEDTGERPGGPGAGQLELHVPPASESVRVRVSLEFMPPHDANCSSSVATAPINNCKNPKYMASRTLTSSCGGSWISIRGIQKKWSGYRSEVKPPTNGFNNDVRRAPECVNSETSQSRPGERKQPAADCGCRCPPRKPPRCSPTPGFSQILC